MTPQAAALRLQKVLGKDYLLHAEAALYEEGHRIIKVAIPLTPLRDGYLRNSAFVKLPNRKHEVIVGFGGFAAKYALYVHEMPAGNTWTEPGTGPKYLTRAADQSASGMADRIARSMTKAARFGSTRVNKRKPDVSG